MPYSVLIADCHEVIHSGLREVFDRVSELIVVGEASDRATALELARKHQPSVIILDLGIAETNQIDVIGLLLSESPKSRVLLFTAVDTAQAVQDVFKVGAAGYLTKTAAIGEVVTAVLAVAAGRAYISITWAKQLFCRRVDPAVKTAKEIIEAISPREKEVLQRIAVGKTNQQTADELAVSVKTVETYRYRLRNKIGTKDRMGISRFAEQAGLLSTDSRSPLSENV